MIAHAKPFNALGDPTRRIIFEKLQGGPLAVAAIAKGLKVSRPAVSQHLKVLREARLITMHQQGTKSICKVDNEGLLAIHNYLDRFWDTALADFKRIAEQTEKNKKRLHKSHKK